jgi:hypothetical protein
LHVARRLHKSRNIGARLGAVEREVLGFVRENDVPSGEVSACYLHFLRTSDPRALIGVVEHNAWDVLSMASLVGLYGEPLDGTQLAADDLVGVARTLKRAGSMDLAFDIAERAVAAGAGNEGTRARAEIAKARGDKARALADFEALAGSVDDPKVRLELAKLYEHHAKDAARALAVARAGTGEPEERRAHRAARLERKMQKRLELQGVGYKAEVKPFGVQLVVGFSHPVPYHAPAGVKISVENNVLVSVEGVDKELVGQVAAELRAVRPPEPYKGKGIRYVGEQVRRKAGKTAQAAK